MMPCFPANDALGKRLCAEPQILYENHLEHVRGRYSPSRRSRLLRAEYGCEGNFHLSRQERDRFSTSQIEPNPVLWRQQRLQSWVSGSLSWRSIIVQMSCNLVYAYRSHIHLLVRRKSRVLSEGELAELVVAVGSGNLNSHEKWKSACLCTWLECGDACSVDCH